MLLVLITIISTAVANQINKILILKPNFAVYSNCNNTVGNDHHEYIFILKPKRISHSIDNLGC